VCAESGAITAFARLAIFAAFARLAIFAAFARLAILAAFARRVGGDPTTIYLYPFLHYANFSIFFAFRFSLFVFRFSFFAFSFSLFISNFSISNLEC
jgi:hypothetical protein